MRIQAQEHPRDQQGFRDMSFCNQKYLTDSFDLTVKTKQHIIKNLVDL